MPLYRFYFALLAILALTSAPKVADARPPFLPVFIEHYKLNPDTGLGQRGCTNCHANMQTHSLNPFGLDVRRTMARLGKNQVDEELLLAMDKLDSNGDGRSNLQQIQAGVSPGDPPVGKKVPTQSSAPANETSSVIPHHAFHPAIVHFPIALVLCALAFELYGRIRKLPDFIKAATYCLFVGATGGIAAATTGITAMYLKKQPYEGLIFTHFVLALSWLVLVWATVIVRHIAIKRDKLGWWSLGLLLVASLLVSYVGFLGGSFVFGE